MDEYIELIRAAVREAEREEPIRVRDQVTCTDHSVWFIATWDSNASWNG